MRQTSLYKFMSSDNIHCLWSLDSRHILGADSIALFGGGGVGGGGVERLIIYKFTHQARLIFQ